jgi:hypothetical protein
MTYLKDSLSQSHARGFTSFFDEGAVAVAMRRYRLEDSSQFPGALVTDLRYQVGRRSDIDLDDADYSRLARQALQPVLEAFK